MGLDSIWHWLLLLIVVLLIFGTGKLTKLGPDLGNALRGFKKAMHSDDDEQTEAEKLKADAPEVTPAQANKTAEPSHTDEPKA